MGDLFADYAPTTAMGRPAWDEMFEAPEVPRPAARTLHEALRALSAADFESRCSARDRTFRDRGITFQLSGEERPWPLDLVPRIIPQPEWAVLEAGVVQRVRALEAFLADVYGPGRILADRVVPRRLVTTSVHFHRAAYGVDPPNGVRIHVAGIDVVRASDGRFVVLEDNIRCPSGISYVIENRRMMARIFPELFTSHRVLPVSNYPAHLLEALRAAAPRGVTDPTVAVLTPGVHNAAYFEHTFLARQMGVELVEGRDLVCRNETMYLRTTDGEQRVDVLYRRVDDDFLDPVQFRPDSVLGSPGLLNAARAGKLTIANAVGNGVADDKLAYTYVPDMIRYYLGEEPLLPNVETYRLEDPEQLRHVLDHLDRLVLKPVGGSGGYGIVIGHQATDQQLAEARRALEADPRAWIAQEPVALSTAPTSVGDRLVPRHLDLRPFAVNDGERIWVVPGGLTRVALPEGGLVVNSSQGGGSKDTWVVLTADPADPAAGLLPSEASPPLRTGAKRTGGRPAAGSPRPDAGPAGTSDASQQHQQQQQQADGNDRHSGQGARSRGDGAGPGVPGGEPAC
jgi:uncharacterized circularly permuted ATP-grasp superfamily protein